MPTEGLAQIENDSARLYGFVLAIVGDPEASEKLILRALGVRSLTHPGFTLNRVIKSLVPDLMASGGPHPGREALFQDLRFDPRLTLVLQILAGIGAAEKIFILLRDQLEWSMEEIADCFDLKLGEAENCLRLARLHFRRQKETLLARRKRL